MLRNAEKKFHQKAIYATFCVKTVKFVDVIRRLVRQYVSDTNVNQNRIQNVSQLFLFSPKIHMRTQCEFN